MTSDESSQRKYRLEVEASGDEAAEMLRRFVEDEQRLTLTAYDPEISEEEARYRNPPTYYGVEGVPGMEGDDVE